jgi:CBS-domain-containing membrane protein
MRHRSVADLMTPSAITVQRGSVFKEVARPLDEFGIRALPVVDDAGHPVGVVCEADLLRKHGSGSDTTADPMNAPAVTAHPEWSVVRAARLIWSSASTSAGRATRC